MNDMSDPPEASVQNDQLVLVSGESGSGKSASLRSIRNQERWLYLNCEAGKKLPFRNRFDAHTISDPFQVEEAFRETAPGGSLHDDFDGIIIDTVTFLMDMFESQYVLTSNDTQKAWGQYAQFFARLMQQHVGPSDKAVIIMGHNKELYDEKTLTLRTRLGIKGAIGNDRGAEAFFSTVVSTKKVELKKLEGLNQDLLTITPEDEALGFKHVFQTRLTKETTGERIRSPMGMFAMDQPYMDNDAQMLLDHLGTYYT